MANDVIFAPFSSLTTGQAPIVIVPNTAGDIADIGNIRQEPEALRQAAARMRGAVPETNSERNIRLAKDNKLVLNGEVPVGSFAHVVARNIAGGPGGLAAFASKQGEMLRFLATVEEGLDKAPRAQALTRLQSKKAQLEATLKAILKLEGIGGQRENDDKTDVKRPTNKGSTTQAAPPLPETTGSGPAGTTADFRGDADVMREARKLSVSGTPPATRSGTIDNGSLTGMDLNGLVEQAEQNVKNASPEGIAEAKKAARKERFAEVGGSLKNGLATVVGIGAEALNAELAKLNEAIQILDSEANVNSQFRSLEGVLGQGKYALEMERYRTDGQQMQGFNNYIAETARWHFITDLNMTFGMQLGALGLNFSPFAAGGLPMDLMQAAISGRGDLWIKSASVTDPVTGEPIWYIPEGGNVREMMLQQYGRNGVMDQRTELLYKEIIEKFQPVIQKFNDRHKDFSLFPGKFDDYMTETVSRLKDLIDWANENGLAGEIPIPDMDQYIKDFGISILNERELDAQGNVVTDRKGRVVEKPKAIKVGNTVDNLRRDPLDKSK